MNTNANMDVETIHFPSALPYTPDTWTINNNHQRPETHSDPNEISNPQTSSSAKDKDPLAAFYSSLSMPVSIPAHISAPVPNSAASFSSISSWYDPLESIISSTSTSLTNSPSSNLNMSTSTNANNMNTNTNTNITTTLNDQLQQQFLLDTHPHDMHFMNINHNGYSNDFNTDIYTDTNTANSTNNNVNSNSNSTIDNLTIAIKREEGEGEGINESQLAFNFFPTDLQIEIKQDTTEVPVAAAAAGDDDDDETKDVKLSSRPQRKRLTPHQKQAHNKIEKRYRININTKIARLQQIIPWVSSEQTAFEVSDSVRPAAQQDTSGSVAECGAGEDRSVVSSMTGSPNLMEGAGANDNGKGAGTGTGSTRLNKSMILEKAVDYILYLQNNERLYEMEVARLRQEVEELRRINDVTNTNMNSNTGN